MTLWILFPVFSLSGIFGVDFGSENIKISTALPGKGIHIALNQQSKRLTPSYFAFWNVSNPRTTEHLNQSHWKVSDLDNMTWAFFDQAKSHAQRFPNNAFKGVTHVLGSRKGFYNREILAAMLRQLISTIDEGQWKPDGSSVVLVVEPNLPREDRFALLEAVYIANATLTGIVEAPTAAAHVYALEKSYLFDSGPRIVAFFDIGAFHTWAAVFRFTPAENKESPVTVEELGVSYNYTLGASLMDQELAELLMKKFAEVNGVEVKNERTIRQFCEEARRTKELLTVNKVVDVRMEDVIDDMGLTYSMTRHEFNQLIDEFNGSLHNLFYDVVAKSDLNVSDVDSIELLGGTTRVPFVQKSLMDVSGMNKLNRTMNSDEAMALGAGYVAASRSSSFVIRPIRMIQIAGVNVTLVYPNGTTEVLFNESSRTNDPRLINVTVADLGDFTIKCGDVDITTFNITVPPNVAENETISILLDFDPYTLPSVYGAYYFNGTKREICDLQFGLPDWRMTIPEIRNASLFIARMEKIMKERADLQQMKNEYESYIYKLKDQLENDQTFAKVITEEEKKNLTEAVAQHQEWLFGSEPDQAGLFDFSKRLADLSRMADNAEMRAEQLIKRGPATEELEKVLKEVRQAINVDWPEQKPWLFELPQCNRLLKKFNETDKWFNETVAPQMSMSPTANPTAKAEEIEAARRRLQELMKTANRMVKPTPTPTPTTAPVEISSATPLPDYAKKEVGVDDDYVPIDVTGYDNDEL